MLSKFSIKTILPILFVVINLVLSATVMIIGNRDLEIAVACSSLIVTVLYGLYLSRLYKRTKTLEHRSKHDALTGLMNRSTFSDKLQSLLDANSTKYLAVMIMDLNKFKVVNDTLGHLVGDELLQQVAQRLLGTLRDHDCLARLGGDEFAFIFTNYEAKENLIPISQRLLKCFDTPFKLNDQVSEVGASVGIAIYPEHGETPVDLIKCADVAMYTAKNERLGHFVYDKSRDISSIESITLRADLRKAVDSGKLHLHYQPKKSLVSGEIVGVEALARWTHEQLGEISPMQFIPIAEQTGLIRTLTNWVLGKALEDFISLHNLGYLATVSVNISPYSLAQGDLILHISKELARHRLNPTALILEVTETALNQGTEEFIKVLLCLELLGLSISIDDFGVGQSSLVYLKSLPVKEIKIDKSFVSLMLENKQDYNIINSIIQLAHSVGCTVCAEGVETQEAEDALRDMGCDLIQGYYVSKPLALTDLYEFLGVPNVGSDNPQKSK